MPRMSGFRPIVDKASPASRAWVIATLILALTASWAALGPVLLVLIGGVR